MLEAEGDFFSNLRCSKRSCESLSRGSSNALEVVKKASATSKTYANKQRNNLVELLGAEANKHRERKLENIYQPHMSKRTLEG